MKALRERLKEGRFRRLMAWFLPLPFVFLFIKFSDFKSSDISTYLDALQKTAFVAAAFAVTTYNLRTRVVDMVLKIEGDIENIDNIHAETRENGKKLTNLVILFTLTATVMAFSVLSKNNDTASIIMIAIVNYLFLSCVINYLFILLSFEQLEDNVLKEAKLKALQKIKEKIEAKNNEAVKPQGN